MDDQRDYAEEAANRAAMEQEGREEYAAERAESSVWTQLSRKIRQDWRTLRQDIQAQWAQLRNGGQS